MVDFRKGRDWREEVKEEAEGNADRKEIPELGDGVGGVARVGAGGEEEVAGKGRDAEEASTEGRALLIERSGLVGSLVQERVVGHWRVHARHHRLFPACDRGHVRWGFERQAHSLPRHPPFHTPHGISRHPPPRPPFTGTQILMISPYHSNSA